MTTGTLLSKQDPDCAAAERIINTAASQANLKRQAKWVDDQPIWIFEDDIRLSAVSLPEAGVSLEINHRGRIIHLHAKSGEFNTATVEEKLRKLAAA